MGVNDAITSRNIDVEGVYLVDMTTSHDDGVEDPAGPRPRGPGAPGARGPRDRDRGGSRHEHVGAVAIRNRHGDIMMARYAPGMRPWVASSRVIAIMYIKKLNRLNVSYDKNNKIKTIVTR